MKRKVYARSVYLYPRRPLRREPKNTARREKRRKTLNIREGKPAITCTSSKQHDGDDRCSTATSVEARRWEIIRHESRISRLFRFAASTSGLRAPPSPRPRFIFHPDIASQSDSTFRQMCRSLISYPEINQRHRRRFPCSAFSGPARPENPQ